MTNQPTSGRVIMKPTNQNADPWKWVVNHNQTIRRVTRKIARTAGVDFDDLRSETTLYLVARHSKYNPDLGSANTWIWYAARYAATKIQRQRFGKGKLNRVDAETMERIAQPCPDDAIHQQMLVRRLIDVADHGQRQAIESVLKGWNGNEIKSRLNISTHGRNMRLYRLRKSIGATNGR